MSPSFWYRAIVATLVAGALVQVWFRIAPPVGIDPAYAHAFGLSMMGPAIVLAIALVAPKFKFDEYAAERGLGGVALDGVLGFVVCLLVSGLAASWFAGRGTGTLFVVLGLGAAVYFTAFAVFTARAVHFFDPVSEGVM